MNTPITITRTDRLQDALEAFYDDPSKDARIDVAFAIYGMYDGFPNKQMETAVGSVLATIGAKLAIEDYQFDVERVVDLLYDYLGLTDRKERATELPY